MTTRRLAAILAADAVGFSAMMRAPYAYPALREKHIPLWALGTAENRMSACGTLPTLSPRLVTALKRTRPLGAATSGFDPKRTLADALVSARRAPAISFDHLVGAGEEGWGHFEPERLRGLEVDHKLELGWCLHG
jgi:hypothetical protein